MKEQKRYQASPLLKHISSLPDLASFFLHTLLTACWLGECKLDDGHARCSAGEPPDDGGELCRRWGTLWLGNDELGKGGEHQRSIYNGDPPAGDVQLCRVELQPPDVTMLRNTESATSSS